MFLSYFRGIENISQETTHSLKGQNLVLLPEKAIIWSEEQMLILADLHLGKITHFRKQGIPIPKEGEKDNFDRFSFLILNYPVKKILILGDLFHSDYNAQWEAFLEFLDKFPKKEFILVKGNHDILDNNNYKRKNLSVYPLSLEIPPFYFTHHPEDSALYNVCGHIHPGIKMAGKGLQRIRLACFYFGENQSILPAFGEFTGLHIIEPKNESDNIYAITSKRVMKVY